MLNTATKLGSSQQVPFKSSGKASIFNIIKLFILLTIISMVILFLWGILVLFPFSPFRILFLGILFSLLPDWFSSDEFQGNIFPYFIVPILVVLNVLVLRKIDRNNQKYKTGIFTKFILSFVPILVGISIFLAPSYIDEKIHEIRVVNNFNIIGDVSYVLKKSGREGSYYFLITVPVHMDKKFTGTWMGSFYETRFVPSDEQVFSEIKNCELEYSGLDTGKLQPPWPELDTPAGDYDFTFEYQFYGESCSKENFTPLIGKQVELLDITGRKEKVLDTFSVQEYRYE